MKYMVYGIDSDGKQHTLDGTDNPHEAKLVYEAEVNNYNTVLIWNKEGPITIAGLIVECRNYKLRY